MGQFRVTDNKVENTCFRHINIIHFIVNVHQRVPRKQDGVDNRQEDDCISDSKIDVYYNYRELAMQAVVKVKAYQCKV